MYTFCCHTLVDITENGPLKAQFPFKTKSNEVIHDKQTLTVAKNQQSNFQTLLQILQLRGNVVWEHVPYRIHFDMIPIINFCKETATFPANAFITQDPRTINTYFSFVPDTNK